MKIIGTLNLIEVDQSRVKKELHDRLDSILREGVKRWISEAQKHIPIWSGASQSTLSILAGKVGINIAVFPVPGAPSRIDLGEENGQGELRINRSQGRYSFFYATSLGYFINNETKDMSMAMLGRLKTPTPYRFREKADAAFLEYVNKELQGLSLAAIIRRTLRVKQTRF